MTTLDESSAIHNNQLAFSILEKDLGIPPVMSPNDLANSCQIDKLSMVLYLTQVQNAFTVPAKGKCLSIYYYHGLTVRQYMLNANNPVVFHSKCFH